MLTKKLSRTAGSLTNNELEALLAEISDYHLTLEQVESEQEASRRALDAELLPIKERYRPDQDRRAEVIQRLKVTLREKTDVICEWARAHRAEHFTKKFSLELTHATIGFRLTRWRVEELPGGTFARAAQLLAKLAWGRKYLSAPTLKLNEILADRTEFDAKPKRLENVGLQLVQDEVFYVKPKQTRSDLHLPRLQEKEAA